MGDSDYFTKQVELTPSDRHILANWLLIVQVEFKLTPETFQTTLSIIDRFLEIMPIEILQFQLLGITAMFVASKIHELYPPMITDFVQVTKNSFSKDQILKMELQIMHTLDFELNCTIPAALLESYSLAIDVYKDRDVLVSACHHIDICLLQNTL